MEWKDFLKHHGIFTHINCGTAHPLTPAYTLSSLPFLFLPFSSSLPSSDDEFFANLAVDAMLAVKTPTPTGGAKYPVKAVNILKAHGKSTRESVFIRGYALNCTVASQAMPTKIVNAKMACLDMNLQKARMHLGVNIVVDDPDKLEDIRRR